MRVLVVGLGSIARKHIEALGIVRPDAQIYALRHNPQSTKVDGVTNIYTIDEAAELKFDFAIISNPTSKHRQTIEWLSELGIPLFIEKPLFDQLSSPPKVNSLTYVACNLRFCECLEWVKQNIEGRRINEVNAYCGSYLPEWRPDVDWRKIYSANKELGGGVHIDLIHEIDYIYWIFGAPISTSKVFRTASSLEISAFDYANYCLIYSNFAVSVVLNYYRRDYKRTLELLFDDTTWNVDLAANRVTSGDKVLFSGSSVAISSYVKQMRYFIGLIESGSSSSMNPIEEAYEVLKICLNDESGK